MPLMSTLLSSAAAGSSQVPLATQGESTCPGCNKTFTISGFSKHLTMTRQPACVAIRMQRQGTLFSLPSGSATCEVSPPQTPFLSEPNAAEPQHIAFPEVDMEAPPVLFEGDFFGDYSAGDFEVDDSGDGHFPPESGSSDDSDEDDFAPMQPHWEPPPQPLHEHVPPFTGAPSGPNNTSRVSAAAATSASSRAQRQAAEVTAQKRNTYRVPFPVKTAGTPMTTPLPPTATTYEQYTAAVTLDGSENPYAPFTSRLDWEVARWAKLRGPGSTAFSDLLAIEEVRSRIHHTRSVNIEFLCRLRSGSHCLTRTHHSFTRSSMRSFLPRALASGGKRLSLLGKRSKSTSVISCSVSKPSLVIPSLHLYSS